MAGAGEKVAEEQDRGWGAAEKAARPRAAEAGKAAGIQTTQTYKGGVIMPGFNQRGPENQGPMTGGRRGVCTGTANTGQGFGNGMGYGRGNGRRCGGKGFRGQGMGGGMNPPVDPRPAQTAPAKQALQERADLLKAELAAIQKELKDVS